MRRRARRWRRSHPTTAQRLDTGVLLLLAVATAIVVLLALSR